MKTRLIAIFSFLALFLSLSASADFEKPCGKNHYEKFKAKFEKFNAMNDEDLHQKIEKDFRELRKKKMEVAEGILEKNGVNKDKIEAIKHDFMLLKLFKAKCLLHCCKKHHEMMEKMKAEMENGNGEEETGGKMIGPQERPAPIVEEVGNGEEQEQTGNGNGNGNSEEQEETAPVQEGDNE